MISQADLGLLDGFERALINGRLRMAYQPKISLSDGRLRRVEALIRWDDPELGAVPPSRFVPLANGKEPLLEWLAAVVSTLGIDPFTDLAPKRPAHQLSWRL